MKQTTRAPRFILLFSALASLLGSLPTPQYVPWSTIPVAGCSGYTSTVIPMGIAQVGRRPLSGVRWDHRDPRHSDRRLPDNGEALSSAIRLCFRRATQVGKRFWPTLQVPESTSCVSGLAFGSADDPLNTPFVHTSGANCPAGLTPCFRLDQKNQPFFDRLRAVVNEARLNHMFVEVTFFSPFNGDDRGLQPHGLRERSLGRQGRLSLRYHRHAHPVHLGEQLRPRRPDRRQPGDANPVSGERHQLDRGRALVLRQHLVRDRQRARAPNWLPPGSPIGKRA